MKNCFVSWSGGKDALFALYRAHKESNFDSITLLNMCDSKEGKSRSHGISAQLLRDQAEAVGFPIVQGYVDEGNYETILKNTIAELKREKSVTHGIFGDIYLDAHRDWIERVCGECDIIPLFPLWKIPTTDLITDFVNEGFRTAIVAVHQEKLPIEFLRREIDHTFIADLPKEIDPCGELGEYHTFVFDGPLFKKPLPIELGEAFEHNNHWMCTVAIQ